MARPTLIDLNPDEYNQGFLYYPSNKICVPNKTEDVFSI